MIFLTVGTQFPFDRLVMAIDDAFDKNLIREEIFAQIGESVYKPRNFKYVKSLTKESFNDYIRKSSGIIGHAGIGTITTAFDNQKPLLVMPRLQKNGEVVNDHQLDFAEKFEQLGYLLAVYKKEDLPVKINSLKHFIPKKRENQTDLIVKRILAFLNSNL